MRRIPALMTASVVVSMTAASLLAMAPTATAATGGYAALGDSYSSGLGAGSTSGSCDQSSEAYGPLWDAANSPSSFDFAACSGATTADVRNRQLSALNDATALVSITVGGNDAGFTSTMRTCILKGTSACLAAVSTAQTLISGDQFAGSLDSTYAAIRTRAPHAHVVVLGYPHLFQTQGLCHSALDDAARSAVNTATDALDGVIADHAARAGFDFVDVRTAFTGHEICSNDTWLHNLTWPLDESFHPTAQGQADGYLPQFTTSAP